jgi:HSP20 family molecular chaperone IbpA
MRETTEAVREKGRQEFEQRYQNEIQQQSEQLSELNQTASEQLRRSRMDTAQKLAAYEERQEDPFYKLLDLNAQLHDIGDSYVLTARIPPHEQQKVNVSLKGNNQLVISGYRRNEEKLEVGPGRMKGTASHQSYSETFPLSWPVEGRKLEKYFEGDELIVKLPKKTENSVHSVYESDKKAKPERARVQRPTFPENLPNTTANPAPEAGDPALAHSTGAERKSQKTLS